MFIDNRANGAQQSLPRELVVKIFYELDLQEFIRCSEVCALWYKASLEPSCYFALAARVTYFSRKDGPDYFAKDTQTRFIAYYKELQALPLPKGKTYYQALRHYQTPLGMGELEEVWCRILPSSDNCMFDLSGAYKKFAYREKLPILKACICAGALVFEKPLENRLLDLASCHGDTEMVTLVLEDIQWNKRTANMHKVYQNVIVSAVDGHQPSITRHLKQQGTIADNLISSTIRSNFREQNINVTEFLQED